MMPTREATSPLTQTIYPGFSSIRDDPARLAAAYQRAQALVAAVALPAGIGVAVIADPLVRLALGEKWAPVIFIIQALASVYALQTLGSLVQPLGMAKGETRLLFIRDTQMLFVRVPVMIAGLMLYGLAGGDHRPRFHRAVRRTRQHDPGAALHRRHGAEATLGQYACARPASR